MSVTLRRHAARISAVLLASASVAGLTACGSDSSDSSSSSSGGGSGLPSSTTIAFNTGASADPFFVAMKKGAEAEAKAQGVKIQWQGDPQQYSPATQIPILNQQFAQKPAALIIAPTDPKALQAGINTFSATGAPVINVDTHVDDLSKVKSFITGDNVQGGAAAADALAKAMGYKSGGTYQVVVGMTSASTTTNADRLKGFKQQVASKYPGIKIMSVAYSQAQPTKANTNVSNWLSKYPQLKGIFAIDGSNATGASAALQQRKLVGKISLVGYDAYPTNVELLKKGVFSALVAQNPTEEAKMAVQYVVKYLKTKSDTGIEKNVTLPNIVLTPQTPAADLTKYTYPTS